MKPVRQSSAKIAMFMFGLVFVLFLLVSRRTAFVPIVDWFIAVMSLIGAILTSRMTIKIAFERITLWVRIIRVLSIAYITGVFFLYTINAVPIWREPLMPIILPGLLPNFLVVLLFWLTELYAKKK